MQRGHLERSPSWDFPHLEQMRDMILPDMGHAGGQTALAKYARDMLLHTARSRTVKADAFPDLVFAQFLVFPAPGTIKVSVFFAHLGTYKIRWR